MNRLKEFIKKLEEAGIPVVLLRDPVTKTQSLTFSLVIISALLVIFGLVGKFAKLAGGFDIENSLSFFYGCAGMYLGRKITNNNNTVDKQEK
jgi:hypothetical protein